MNKNNNGIKIQHRLKFEYKVYKCSTSAVSNLKKKKKKKLWAILCFFLIRGILWVFDYMTSFFCQHIFLYHIFTIPDFVLYDLSFSRSKIWSHNIQTTHIASLQFINSTISLRRKPIILYKNDWKYALTIALLYFGSLQHYVDKKKNKFSPTLYHSEHVFPYLL